jgi:lactoylglutathione lyase
MTDRMSAVGIAVSDLDRSVDFYTRVLGMRKLMTLNLPEMDEVIVSWSRESAQVVLMHYTDGSDRPTTDLPVKLVLYVDSPAEVADRIRAEGLAIDLEPAPMEAAGGAIIGFARDPDGYTLELVKLAEVPG